MNYDFAAHQALQRTAGDRNLRTALRKLRELGASAFVVEYDGSGDDGQIEYSGVEGDAQDLDARAAAMDVCFWHVKTLAPSEGTEPVFRYRLARGRRSLTDVATDAMHDYLESLWAGWENNDGAFGVVRLDVASGKLSLEHNSRYTSYETTVSDVTVAPTARRAAIPAAV